VTGYAGSERAAIAPYVPDAWTGFESIDTWKQGDMLGPIPWGWVAPAGVDPVTNLEADAGDGLALTMALADTFAVVTSQTCDVATTGPGARHPFVQVSPVVDAAGADPGRLAAIRRWQIVDLAPLDPPGANGTVWIADLRISIPVSKAVLTRFAPRAGFRSEQGYLDFAAHLAAKVERPALHDFVSGEVRQIINDAIKSAGANDTAWWTDVDEIRVRCTPTRLTPRTLEFLIIARDDKLAGTDRGRWRMTINRVRKAAKVHGIEVMHPLHRERLTLSAQDYRSSTALQITELRRVPDMY